MVSFGPATQSYDYTHMYSFVDDRKSKEALKMCVPKGTVYAYIHDNHGFSKFNKVIMHAKMDGQLGDVEYDNTLLAVEDKYLKHIPDSWFDTMDDGLAKQILNASTLRRVIDKELLTSSPVSYFPTLNSWDQLYVTNISGRTRVNECASVVSWDHRFNNGIVHLLNNIIVPNDNTYLN